MPVLQRAFTRRMMEIFGLNIPSKLGIALSGGVDSMALLDLTYKWASSRDVTLHTYIIDHNLRPESSEEAQNLREYIANKYSVLDSVYKLQERPPSRGIEEWARNARRRAFYEMCKRDGVTALLLGHHFDDQRELFIQRLLAGSQWEGMAGMRQQAALFTVLPAPEHHKVNLIRPLLDIRKNELQNHCKQQLIKWWEDPTNHKIDYTNRNLIRKYFAVVPTMEQPQYVRIDESRELLKYLSSRRDAVLETASGLYQQSLITKRLVFVGHNDEAELDISGREFQETPTAVLTELLYRIAAPLSPASPKTLGSARFKLKPIAEMVRLGQNFTANALQVEFCCKKNKLKISREPIRRTTLRQVVVYKAADHWSKWESLDNRWMIRFKLSGNTIKRNRGPYFDVRFIKNPAMVLRILRPDLRQDNSNAARIVKLMQQHPMFMWTDPEEPYSVTATKVIGFPTLGIMADGLDVDCIPKECAF